jgi:DNA repair protein RadC
MKEAKYRLRIIREGSPPEINVTCDYDVYKIMQFLVKEDREKFYALHLDAKNGLLSTELISIGTLTHSLIHPREVFKGALLNNAHSVILVHNHPSGDARPSTDDLLITERLEQAGILIGINVIDHIIIGDDNYHSIKKYRNLNNSSNLSKKSKTKKNKINETIESDSKVAEIFSERVKGIKKLIQAYPETKPLVIEILQTKTIMETALESLTDSVISFLKQSVTHQKILSKGGSHESTVSS